MSGRKMPDPRHEFDAWIDMARRVEFTDGEVSLFRRLHEAMERAATAAVMLDARQLRRIQRPYVDGMRPVSEAIEALIEYIDEEVRRACS